MTPLATPIIQKTKTLTILQRIAARDRTAVADCVDSYGNLIWALARQFTGSLKEAKAATQEIFLDIWRSADRFTDQFPNDEKVLIALIAGRSLIKFSEKIHPKSVWQTRITKSEPGQGGRHSRILRRMPSVTKIRRIKL